MPRTLALAALLALALAGPFPERAVPFEGRTLEEGGYFRLEDHLGKTPILLYFWSSHCRGCLAEGPFIAELSRRYRGRVLFVGIDVQDFPRMARFRVRDWGWEFPVVVDYYADVARAYGVRATPTTFLLDREGRVVYVRMGTLDERVITERIEELLSP